MTSKTTRPPKTRELPALCALCVMVRDQPNMKPTYLVHPVTGDLMLFDVRGGAVCPTCGAPYRRTLNVIALLE